MSVRFLSEAERPGEAEFAARRQGRTDEVPQFDQITSTHRRSSLQAVRSCAASLLKRGPFTRLDSIVQPRWSAVNADPRSVERITFALWLSSLPDDNPSSCSLGDSASLCAPLNISAQGKPLWINDMGIERRLK